MQYLMMDTHQRFIGTVTINAPIQVGATFEAQDTKTYMVVSLNGNKARRNINELTVILHSPRVAF